MSILFLLVILVVAVIGATASYYIYHHRLHGQSVECVVSVDCDPLLASRYSSFRGVRNEIIGLWGFGGLVLFTLADILVGGGLVYNILIFMAGLLAGGYGGYLIYIQFRVLKRHCTWCLIPAIAGVVVLIASVGIIIG